MRAERNPVICRDTKIRIIPASAAATGASFGYRRKPGMEAVDLIGGLLSLPARHPAPELSPQQRKEKTLAALLAQLDGLARQQPVLMLFEDLHWIDPTSFELLAAIVDSCAAPAGAAAGDRPSGVYSALASQAHVTALSLTRLSRGERAAMVDRITAGKALPAEVLEQILARTDGVALFIEELTKTVIESGMLIDMGDRYAMAGPLPSTTAAIKIAMPPMRK